MGYEHGDGAFCPRFHMAVELIGRRWTGAILRAMRSGRSRFTDIAAAIPGLHDRLLADRLRELEAAGVIRREVSVEPSHRVDYRMTEMGEDLDTVLDAVAHWAERWVTVPGEPAEGGGCSTVTDGSDTGRVGAAVTVSRPSG